MKKTLLFSLTLAAVTIFATGCGGGSSKKTADADTTSKSVLVKTLPATLEQIDNKDEFTSTIQAKIENNISPASPVRIDKIYVEVGNNVRKGQLLAKMDATTFNQTNIQLTNLEADYQRMKTVYEAGGISKQSMDQAEAAYLVQKEQLSNLQINMELRSPIDGVVTARNYDAGDMYNGSTPVLTVMQINNLKIIASISEQYFPLVKVGMPADIKVDMYPDRTFEGKVSLIHPAIDTGTRTFTVEIAIPNSKLELRPGMFSRTTIHFGTVEGIVVEDVAVQKQVGSNEKYLFVAKNGKAERRLVTTGRQIGKKIEILSGVDEGEEVIVAGIARLEDGRDIEIRND